MSEFITICEPESGNTAEVTEEAFDLLWSAKGWEKVDIPATNLTNAEGGVDNLPVPEDEAVPAEDEASDRRDEDAPGHSGRYDDPGDLPE